MNMGRLNFGYWMGLKNPLRKLDEYNEMNPWRSNATYFEVFDPETEEWSDLKRNSFFPEGTEHYWSGSSVTKEDSFLVFGGNVGVYENLDCEYECYSSYQTMPFVLEYKNDRWYNLGTIDQIIYRLLNNSLSSNFTLLMLYYITYICYVTSIFKIDRKDVS